MTDPDGPPTDAGTTPQHASGPGLAERTRTFIDQRVMPLDDEFDGDATAAGGDALRRRLQAEAMAAGVFGPHLPVEFGGRGLGMCERIPVFQAAGRSLFGAMAINANAPDEGNQHLLDQVASKPQRERYLSPIATGQYRSAFAMTEPPPGAGSDPSLLRTSALRTSGGWLIRGSKRFITGADGADLFIVMARTSGGPGEQGGATLFLIPSTAEGLNVTRHVRTMDKSMIGGHCEVELRDVFVPDEDVLGEPDDGFRLAQLRLGPARMTHVMRWSGAAARAHEVAIQYVVERSAFGRPIASHGIAQAMIADNEIDLAATRALLESACADLDRGSLALESTSIAKTFASEALHRVVDRSQQLAGGLGVSDDLPIAKIAREIRPFRIYDGPSEVHRWAIARRAIKKYA